MLGEGVCQIQVSHSDRSALEELIERLLERRLIACGQVLGPIRSCYRWEGRVERQEEWLGLLKTAASRAAEVQALLAELHPYEVPEILLTQITAGHPPYLQWVLEQTTAALPGDAPG